MSTCLIGPPLSMVDSPSQPSTALRSPKSLTDFLAPPISVTPSGSILSEDRVIVLKLTEDLVRLLQWYYDQKRDDDNPFRVEATFFPWLHHLYLAHQRQFFASDSNCRVLPPLTCNLITVECSVNPDLQGTWRLINSVPIEDLLTAPPQSSLTQVLNRNFGSQLSLMAQALLLLLYGLDISYLHRCAQFAKPLCCGTIFICVLNLSSWLAVPKFLRESLVDSKWSQTGLLTKSPPNPARPHRFCPLLAYEQALLFAVHGTVRLFDHLVVGTAEEFNTICKLNFKLIIECHDLVTKPPLYETLLMVAHDWHRQMRNTHYYLEFPLGSYSYAQAPSFVNAIRIMHELLHSGAPIYLFSFDGFTGVLLFMVAMAKVMWRTLIENAITELVTRRRVRLYLFKTDYAFLKGIEKYLDQISKSKLFTLKERLPDISRNFEVAPSTLPRELPQVQTMNHPVRERGLAKGVQSAQPPTPSQTSLAKPSEAFSMTTPNDWFQAGADINFPATILDNELYLGSWLHASSYTVVGALNIERIISLGDCPRWCLSSIDSGQYTELWRYEDIRILEVDCTRLPNSPPLVKSVIFLYNFNDDGRDLLLPFLFRCPSAVKAKLGLDKGGFGSEVRPRPRPCPRTLVHCRIGVLRLALLVIALLMVKFNLLLAVAYLYVRVQRFNIIIQPNLKLMYSLWLWDKHLHGGVLAWEVWALWIDSLNRHYIDND